jgi:ElaB/YqjD/DUF883 family membrane-anchored ribosome-binding protein
MVDTTATQPTAKTRKTAAPKVAPADGLAAQPASSSQAKERFSKAIDEAKAGAQAAREEAYVRAGEYRDRLHDASSDWIEEARVKGEQAKDRAAELALEGKVKTTEALKGLSKLVNENAPVIDEKLGLKYGDYARSAARSVDSAANKLDAKDLNELGEDAKEFVRQSPALAVGMAAVAGFMLARLFKGSDN